MLKDIINNISKKDSCMDKIKEFMKLIEATDDDLLLFENPIDDPLVDAYLYIGSNLPRKKLEQIINNFDFMKDECMINSVTVVPVSFINRRFSEIKDYFEQLGRQNVVLINFLRIPKSVKKYF